MSEGRGRRVVIAGASGALGSEVIGVLAERGFPVSELRAFATDRSTGRDVEFGEAIVPIESGVPPLRGWDLLIVCTPREAARALVREALRAEVACIDASGALACTADVPLGVAELTRAEQIVAAPVVAAPAGPALSWARIGAALEAAAPLERLSGTVMLSAAHRGSAGIDALSEETLALLGQQEPPASNVFPTDVAFDCVPLDDVDRSEADDADTDDADAATPRLEREIGAVLARVLGRALPLSAQAVQVPTFVGEGSALAIGLRSELDPDDALAALEKAPGVARWRSPDARPGPSLRDAIGRDGVLVAVPRRDRAQAHGLLLWAAADPIRLAAVNAVKLAETRLRLH